MRQPALSRNQEEALTDFVGFAKRHDLVVRDDVGDDRRGRGKNAGASLAKTFDQRAVVELTDDPHMDAFALEPTGQRAMQHAVAPG